MTIFFLVKEGIVGLKRARISALISIASISLSLTLLGIFGLSGLNLKDFFLRFYQQVEIEAFLYPSTTDRQIDQLKNEIGKDARVKNVRYISPAEALQEFKTSFGEDLSEVLDENPLPPSLRITLKPTFSNLDEIDKLASEVSENPQVQETIFQKEIIRIIHNYFGIALIFSGILALILVVIVTILIFNTIRLTIHARKNIIEIMHLVGATNFFIKSPFIIEGIVQGIIGGVLGSGIIWLLEKSVRKIIFPDITVPQDIYMVLIALGLIVGLIGSYLSVNKYLQY